MYKNQKKINNGIKKHTFSLLHPIPDQVKMTIPKYFVKYLAVKNSELIKFFVYKAIYILIIRHIRLK